MTKILENHTTVAASDAMNVAKDYRLNTRYVRVVMTPTGTVAATGAFTVSAGTLDAGVNYFAEVTVNGVDILGAPVDHTGDNSTTATALAAAITSYVSVPNYTAAAVGAVVTITAVAAGSAPNGFVVAVDAPGDAAVTAVANMADGDEDLGTGSVKLQGRMSPDDTWFDLGTAYTATGFQLVALPQQIRFNVTAATTMSFDAWVDAAPT